MGTTGDFLNVQDHYEFPAPAPELPAHAQLRALQTNNNASCKDAATIGPSITGLVSVASSSLVIYMILRSDTKLSSIYHRIMLGMCVADILSSVAMSLTTIPMPPTLDPDLTPYVYPWEGGRYGTSSTCAAQGFFYSSGIITMYAYNAMLCVYYACVIAIRMKEYKIKKYVEPFLHLTPVALGLGLGFEDLSKGLYRPSDWVAWCTAVSTDSSVVVLALIATLLVIIFTSFALIIWRVIKTENQLPRIVRESRFSRAAQRVQKSHQNSKIIFLQALGYILALFSSLILPFISSFSLVNNDPTRQLCGTYILVPLQGFFNALIFVGHKIYNYRRVHTNLSMWKTFHLLLAGKANDHVLFSRISNIEMDAINSNIIDVRIENEEHQNEHVCVDIMQIQSQEIQLQETQSHGSRMDLSGNIDMNEIFEDDLSGFSALQNFGGETTNKTFNNIEDHNPTFFSDSENTPPSQTPTRDILLSSSFESSEDTTTNLHQSPQQSNRDTGDDLSVSSCTTIANLSPGQVSAGMNSSVALSQTPGISIASRSTRGRWSTSLGEESSDNNDLSVTTSSVFFNGGWFSRYQRGKE